MPGSHSQVESTLFFGFDAHMTPHWRTIQLHETHLRPQLVRGETVAAPRVLTPRSTPWECPLEPGTQAGQSSATGIIWILPPPC